MFRDGMEILYEEEGRGFVGLSYEPFLQNWVLHVNFNPNFWTEVYTLIKYCLKVFESILNELRSRGIKLVLGLCATEKEAKFNRIFGFQDTGLVAQTDKGIQLLYKLEL